jgi:hypothetical protein
LPKQRFSDEAAVQTLHQPIDCRLGIAMRPVIADAVGTAVVPLNFQRRRVVVIMR